MFQTQNTSAFFRVPLREYQLIGVQWMARTFQSSMGCILADATGLGKKVQAVGFLAYLAAQHKLWGPNLVVAPTYFTLAWEKEFEQLFPACRIYAYYGDADRRRKLRKVC
jgi:SNF2 family DNA or RNA helicase